MHRAQKMEGSGHHVAIITGAASGIGEETSYAFAKRGMSLALVDMNAEGLLKVADNLKNMGVTSDKVMTIKEDISHESSYDSIIDQTISKYGRIDVLVNNAGFLQLTQFEDLTPEFFEREYQVMLKAPLFLSQKAFPHLKKTKGCIINMSSMASRNLAHGLISYCSIKAGLEHLTRGLALVGAPNGIRVNSVHPGVVRTSILKDDPHEELYQMGKDITPLGRLGTVTDIASAVSFLASDSASFITGASLVVDGGTLLNTPTKQQD